MALISSLGAIWVTSGFRPSTARTSGDDRDRLGAARVDAAARRDQRLVVVLPARARQREQALALGEDRSGVRLRVEEDVAVIERGQQADVPRQQHAVAEHVTGHVADADDGEVLRSGSRGPARGSGA